jgi:hypothetical protein
MRVGMGMWVLVRVLMLVPALLGLGLLLCLLHPLHGLAFEVFYGTAESAGCRRPTVLAQTTNQ